MPEFDCPSPITADVQIRAGSVEIVAEDRATAAVRVEPYDSSAERGAAEQTRVEMRGDTLVVEAPDGRLFRRSARLRVELRMPADGAVRVNVASADVTCRGRFSGAMVQTASGDVQIEHVTGDASVNTASGDLHAIRVDGKLNVHTASGDISARQVGGDATANTASGDVAIDRAAAGVRVNSASGDVRVGAVRRGTVRVDSASGDVSIGVAAGTAVWLDVTTMSGSTRSDLEMTGAQPAGHELTLQIRTMSGDIELRRVASAAA